MLKTLILAISLGSSAVAQDVPAASQLSLPLNLDEQGFDTGVAVSNPSQTAGGILFILYGTDEQGEVASHKVTSAELALAGLGVGLSPDGRLAAGATYTVLVSELAKLAEIERFSGQLKIAAAFPQAQAVNFIYNEARNISHGFSAMPLSTEHSPPVWSVKYSCGFDSTFRVGLFFTDINIHNPNTVPIVLSWKTVEEPDEVIAQGQVTIPANGVLNSGCGEEPFNMPFPGVAPFGGAKGFVEIGLLPVSPQGETVEQLLRVVAVYKNLDPYETRSEKGFTIVAVETGSSQKGGRFAYTSEFLCGNAPARKPRSTRDLLALVQPENVDRVWRPGFISTNVMVHNPTSRAVSYSWQIIDTNNDVLAEEWLTLPANGVDKLDCSLVPGDAVSEGFVEGVVAIRSSIDILIVIFDKEDYNSEFSVTMHIEYVRPNRAVGGF